MATVAITYAAANPAPTVYITKLTCTELPTFLLHTAQPDVFTFNVILPDYSIVHQETRAIYDDGSFQVQTKDFQVNALTAPRNLKVQFSNQSLPTNRDMVVTVTGATKLSGPNSANGTANCPWDGSEWYGSYVTHGLCSAAVSPFDPVNGYYTVFTAPEGNLYLGYLQPYTETQLDATLCAFFGYHRGSLILSFRP